MTSSSNHYTMALPPAAFVTVILFLWCTICTAAPFLHTDHERQRRSAHADVLSFLCEQNKESVSCTHSADNSPCNLHSIIIISVSNGSRGFVGGTMDNITHAALVGQDCDER